MATTVFAYKYIGSQPFLIIFLFSSTLFICSSLLPQENFARAALPCFWISSGLFATVYLPNLKGKSEASFHFLLISSIFLRISLLIPCENDVLVSSFTYTDLRT